MVGYITLRPAENGSNWSLARWTSEISHLELKQNAAASQQTSHTDKVVLFLLSNMNGIKKGKKKISLNMKEETKRRKDPMDGVFTPRTEINPFAVF